MRRAKSAGRAAAAAAAARGEPVIAVATCTSSALPGARSRSTPGGPRRAEAVPDGPLGRRATGGQEVGTASPWSNVAAAGAGGRGSDVDRGTPGDLDRRGRDGQRLDTAAPPVVVEESCGGGSPEGPQRQAERAGRRGALPRSRAGSAYAARPRPSRRADERGGRQRANPAVTPSPAWAGPPLRGAGVPSVAPGQEPIAGGGRTPRAQGPCFHGSTRRPHRDQSSAGRARAPIGGRAIRPCCSPTMPRWYGCRPAAAAGQAGEESWCRPGAHAGGITSSPA